MCRSKDRCCNLCCRWCWELLLERLSTPSCALFFPAASMSMEKINLPRRSISLLAIGFFFSTLVFVNTYLYAEDILDSLYSWFRAEYTPSHPSLQFFTDSNTDKHIQLHGTLHSWAVNVTMLVCGAYSFLLVWGVVRFW
eukprot:TRINITY_DN14246_c0_g13_i2.p2 TRINITY_DN14246_c0_g13~~TRINITY_DN14246_c0_g13_i2.p2  ORF type:complete len:139 (-),score=4.36 TRINITY_DN14246_c0_g13_i2:160-576(-)